LVDVKMGSGSVDLSNISGDVRIVAISSNITVQCVKGDVAARVLSSEIAVSNVGGDVELNGYRRCRASADIEKCSEEQKR
jgi:DUF4097 and DUF4098 domain-containing protein YvlB